jgi:hypothetical protein
MILNIFTDGGGGMSSTYCDCAAAYVVETSENMYLGSRSVCLVGTNNDAEYMGVLSALRDMKAGERFIRFAIACHFQSASAGTRGSSTPMQTTYVPRPPPAHPRPSSPTRSRPIHARRK